VDFSAFNLQEKRPQLVRRIKALQPEASNRAIAEAIGVAHETISRDVRAGTSVPGSDNEITGIADQAGTDVPAVEPAPDDEAAAVDEDEEELPAFLCGEGWTVRERAHAYAVYLGLPAALQPTVGVRIVRMSSSFPLRRSNAMSEIPAESLQATLARANELSRTLQPSNLVIISLSPVGNEADRAGATGLQHLAP
jgi:hypothetical protein